MSERVYRLKQAEVTIRDRKPWHKSLNLSSGDYRELLKRLKEMRLAGQHEDTQFSRIKREVQDFRHRRRKKRTIIYEVTVKLSDPRYSGYSSSYEIALNDDESSFAEQMKGRIRGTIQTCRAEMRNVHENIVKFGKFHVHMICPVKDGPRVFKEKDNVLRLYVQKNMKGLFADKKPEVKTTKYVGIELEFCAPIKEEYLALTLFRSGLQKFVQLKKDGSLRPREGENGFELALLLPEPTYKKQLAQVLNVLKDVKAVAVDRRCGLHVHLDMRQRNKDRVFSNLVSCQQVLMKLVDPRRRDNEFCQTVDSKKMPINFKGTRQERYKTINAASYYKYRTLEVRMHEGSVDYGQITGWVDLLIKIANHRKVLTRSIHKLTIFKKRFNLNKKIYQYAVDRNCYWQINNEVGPVGYRTAPAFDVAERLEQIQNRSAQVEARVSYGSSQTVSTSATERQGA